MKLVRSRRLWLSAILSVLPAALAAQLMYSNDKAVIQIMAECERQVSIAERSCRPDECVATNRNQWRGYVDNLLKQPNAIGAAIADAEKRLREAGSAATVAHQEAALCLFRATQRFASGASPAPTTTATPSPRPPAPPPPLPAPTPDSAAARSRLMDEYKAVLDDVLAELERVEVMRKNAPPPPKNAAALKDQNTRGEDAVACLGIVWPNNTLSAPLIQNHCAYPVEAVWCVQPCGKSGNMWTIFPTSDDYVGYPIIEAEKVLPGRVIWFGGCKGRNSIHAGSKPQTYTCGPPGK